MPAAAAPEIGKRIAELKAQQAALEAEIAAQARASFPATEELVKDAVGVLRELGETAANGGPKAINETLRRMGARAALEVTPQGRSVRVTFGNPPRKGGSKPKKTPRKGPLRLSRSPRPSCMLTIIRDRVVRRKTRGRSPASRPGAPCIRGASKGASQSDGSERLQAWLSSAAHCIARPATP